MTDDINETIARWCGFKIAHWSELDDGYEDAYWWEYKGEATYLPNFLDPIEGLGLLFKYAIPILLDKRLTINHYSFKQRDGRYYSEYAIYEEMDSIKCGKLLIKDFQMGNDLVKTDTTALATAIYKLIKEGKC